MKKTLSIEERFDSQEIVYIYNIIYVYNIIYIHIYTRKIYKARIGESEKENSLIHHYNEKF